MLMPCMAFAQQKVTTTSETKPFLKVHFSTLKMNTTKLNAPQKSEISSMTVHDGDFLLTDTLPVEKLPVKRKSKKLDCNFRAEQVAISYNYSHVLKGDVLEYDNVSKKGVLKGHVTLSRNGVDEEIGKYAMVDFSDNRYAIEKLR